MAGLTLQQRQTQQLKLTPAQLQVIKLLELPACDLQQRINEELQENPVLEESSWKEDTHENTDNNDDENYNDDYNENDHYEEYDHANRDYDDDNSDDYDGYTEPSSHSNIMENTLSTSMTLMEYLKQQIYLTKMTKPERHVAKWVIGNIDDDGFLRRTTEQLVDDLAFQEGITIKDEQMEVIVQTIKQFDPVGVAAANLQECLITQLRHRPMTDTVNHALTMLEKYFDAYTNHRYATIQQTMNISETELKEAISEITKLNQKPANAFTGNSNESRLMTIQPDFVVENRDGELVILLNDGNIPPLHVSEDYTHMLQSYSNDTKPNKEKRDAIRFIRAKIDAASWFIQALQQRNETLMHTMKAIVASQRDFFLEGGTYNLKPLRMIDIADKTGYDVSTISRVSNSKYVQTEYGIFPLKFFFNDATTNADGEEITTQEVKHILETVIAQEDKTNPLTDDQLVNILQEQGYQIARRTVAKYRVLLNIPVARLRKGL